MDSETDFSSDSDYDEFVTEIQFAGDILQPCQFESVFTAAKTQVKNTYLILVPAVVTGSYVIKRDAQLAFCVTLAVKS